MNVKRKLIQKNENKVSILQMIGFILLLLGIISLITVSFLKGSIIPSVISVAFFTTMLGFSFAFPSLLAGNDGLSTMRIVVFMVTNVICMLLLKIGWADTIKSLADIGLNQWWMGVIAFVFGAKATQTFFESKMAVPKEIIPTSGMAAIEYSNADIAKLAVKQNEQYLKVKFPNIASISDAVHDLNNTESHVIALYLKDNNTMGIPDKLEVKMPDGTIRTIATEVNKAVGTGTIQVNQMDHIITNDNSESGSVCCIVKLPGGNEAIVTAGHVYSRGLPVNAGGFLNPQENVVLNDAIIGKWLFQLITSTEDIALIQFTGNNNDPGYKKFSDSGFYSVSQTDVKTNTPNVTLISNISGKRDAFLLDYNTAWDVPYKGEIKLKSNIILVGSTNNRDSSQPVSKPGDSGGCVYHKDSGKFIGLILGRNDKYTWVLPLKETFDFWDFSLV
jgi:hypothetical protein